MTIRVAVLDGIHVVNCSVVESVDAARALFPNQRIVEFTDENLATVGGTIDESTGKFIIPKPYPSWVWHEEGHSWIPPKAIPHDSTFMVVWSEEVGDWVRAE
jgi:hypothetical protein